MGFNIERADKPFVVKSPYKPSGDQPQAIEELSTRIENGENDVVLMGATGTGKTATTAWLIERLQRPTLIIEPNKTLAAQLCAEFRELMPDNAVSYFVSYYDYYQPEAYIPQTDTYIEKDSNINDIEEHRVKVDGYYYWVFRMNPADAARRKLKKGDLIEVFNDRGSVICYLELTERVPEGVVHSYESSANYDPLGEPGHSTDRGGCINILTPSRFLSKYATGMSTEHCLVEVEKWEGGAQ